MTTPAPGAGDTSSDFGSREKQVTQTVGVNPSPPANRSASAPADSVPPVYPGDCIIGPYDGLTC